MRTPSIDMDEARRLYTSGAFRSRKAVAEYMGVSEHAVVWATRGMTKGGEYSSYTRDFNGRPALYQRGYDLIVRERLSYNKAAERVGVRRSGLMRAFLDDFKYLKINRWAHDLLGEGVTYYDIYLGITCHNLQRLYATNLFSQVDLVHHLGLNSSRRLVRPLAGMRPRWARIRPHRAFVYCPDSPIGECCQCILRTGECCWETGHKPFLEVTDELGIEVLLR